MSGHSHWATIKRKKGAADAKKGKVFSKLAKEIMIAVREGGPSPDTNYKLKFVMDKAREVSMPKANIDRAIQKMSGGGGEENFAELTYEGYGPGGIAIIVEAVTTNRNRTSAELRKIFENKGGKFGESVSYLFAKRGVINVPCSAIPEDKLMEIIIEAGAENYKIEDGFYEIVCEIPKFQQVKTAIDDAKIPIESADLVQLPQNLIAVDENVGKKIMDLVERLEDHEDTQKVFTNCDFPESLLEAMEKE